MSEEFDKIHQDLMAFQARIKTWNESNLEDHELDEIDGLVEQTVSLLLGDVEGEDEEYEDEEDY